MKSWSGGCGVTCADEKCAPRCREAYFQVKMHKTHNAGTTFGSWREWFPDSQMMGFYAFSQGKRLPHTSSRVPMFTLYTEKKGQVMGHPAVVRFLSPHPTKRWAPKVWSRLHGRREKLDCQHGIGQRRPCRVRRVLVRLSMNQIF